MPAGVVGVFISCPLEWRTDSSMHHRMLSFVGSMNCIIVADGGISQFLIVVSQSLWPDSDRTQYCCR